MREEVECEIHTDRHTGLSQSFWLLIVISRPGLELKQSMTVSSVGSHLICKSNAIDYMFSRGNCCSAIKELFYRVVCFGVPSLSPNYTVRQ